MNDYWMAIATISPVVLIAASTALWGISRPKNVGRRWVVWAGIALGVTGLDLILLQLLSLCEVQQSCRAVGSWAAPAAMWVMTFDTAVIVISSVLRHVWIYSLFFQQERNLSSRDAPLGTPAQIRDI